jgi:pentapeptide MXKDX repeat protein
MKKLITAAAATAFVLGTTLAFAEDTKQNSPTEKTATQQQQDTQSKDKMKKSSMKKSGTTGSGMDNKANPSKLPGKPTDTVNDVKK